MKTSVWRILILIMIVGLTGCKKNDDDETPVIQEETGAIFVTFEYDGEPIPEAIVTTKPETAEATTNELGNTFIENVPQGIYHVFATLGFAGSGSAAVDVNAGEVENVTIQLITGAFEELFVDILPMLSQNIFVGQPVDITALVSDYTGNNEELVFEWSTEIDGVISTQGVGDNGYASIEHAFDTPGERTVTVTVTNSEGDTDSDEVVLNIMEMPDIVLAPIEAEGYTLHLNWTQPEVSGFLNYRVYREDQNGTELIEYISDINTTSYVDHDVVIGLEYTYQIGMYMGNSIEFMSNTETGLFEGEYIDIGTDLDRLVQDPNNPMIYGLDTDNNSLVFINTDMGEVVNTIYVGSMPTDMDFSLDNQLLYIANHGSTEIVAVDLASQSVQSSFFVNPGTGFSDGNPYTLAVMANGLLAFSGSEGFNNPKLVDITTGEILFTTSEDAYEPYLAANSDGTQLFVGESGLSSCKMHRFDLIEGELLLQETSNNFSPPTRRVFVAENDDFVFYAKRKFQASNLLNLLGTFSDNIYAINSDGSLALGEDKIYNGFNYNTVDELPLSTKVSAFGNDGETAYLFQNETDRLYKITVE